MRFHKTRSFRRTVRSAAQRGQSIIVALLVLLLLGLAGALFVTIIARNVLNARRANRTITADQYARAGITFADAQLSNSLDGADWRPPLQYKLSVSPTEQREAGRYATATANLGSPDPNDPDLKYLEAGFTRYNTGAGRFLLRLTYTPVLQKDVSGQFYDPVIGTDASGAAIAPVVVPPGKYIKIEAIGREGVIEPLDPTTFTNSRSSDKLQAYQVAYKPIGITDYARFETNIDNRSDTANLGVNSRFYQQDTDGQIGTPGVYDFNSVSGSGVTLQQYPVLTTYGAADAYQVIGNSLVPNPQAGTNTKINVAKFMAGGGSIHANMPVRFFGKNIVYLNNAGANAPLYQDGVEVAGDLLLNGYQPAIRVDNSNSNGSGQRTALILNPPDLATLKTNGTNGTFIVPSNDNGSVDKAFSTKKGLIRDGATGNDGEGLPRGIGRVEPPLMDAIESATRIPRYKALAMMSPPRIDPTTGKAYVNSTGTASPSQYGYGQSIYINNVQDVQENSKSVGGGSTLIDQWLNRTTPAGGNSKGGWNRGDFYDPPGVNITLGRQSGLTSTAGKSSFGLRLTLFSDDPKTPVTWPNPDGSAGTDTTKTVLFDDINASNDSATSTGPNPDNDVIIYAEGNIRVHGIASADPADTTATDSDKYPRHITLVTNGTAYIEGSVLKGNPDSSITILAHDYVCVNTTQFLAGPILDDYSIGTPTPGANSDPNYHALAFGSDQATLVQELTFGLPNGATPASTYGPNLLGLYVSGRPGDTGATQADFEIVNPVTGLNLAGNTPFMAGSPATATVTFDPASGTFGQQYVDLSGFADNSMTPATTLNNLVESNTRLLETRRSITAQQDLELERVAVLPMDVRIEAILYAQTGSFFVIPGAWFNSSSTDSLDVFAPTVTTTTPAGIRSSGANPHFPFYGQPIDMKIIIDGTVSEAQPADVANQTAWMLKWGWIPQYHGFTGATPEPAGHQLAGKPAVGLQIIYNPQAGYPYHPSQSATDKSYYLRSDTYGRPLPFSPKLPVSTGMLYAGESSEPPLLQ